MVRGKSSGDGRSVQRWLVLASAICVLITAGCGDSDGGADIVFTVPDVSGDTGADQTTGWPIADTVVSPDVSNVSDIQSLDVAAADAGDDLDSADAPEQVDNGPETVVPITSCSAHCGVYLENNPCHCHESCLGEGSCCSDFVAVCKCAKDADCDDANDCTSDTCKASGYCFQQPMKSCCLSDSECGGGDACNTAKCIAGSCTLQPMDCDDGIACTGDFCDKGACQHKIQANQCLIDGACQKAGDQDPATGGCASCDPAKSQTNWTAAAGKCAIDGQCVKSGEISGDAACAVCDPAKSTSGWSAKSGTCFIDGACYKSGEASPAGSCEICDPTSSQTQWSAKSGFCAIDGQCYATGTVNPANSCETCDPAKSKVAWTPKAGMCNIDGLCVADGKSAPGSGGCKVCDAKKPTAWVIKTGVVCSAGSICIANAKCDATGACVGTQKSGCCVQNADCENDPKLAPGPCDEKACNVGLGICELKAKPGCCTTGVCCDAINQTVQPTGTVCNFSVTLDTEYKCDGDAGYKRALHPGCDGLSPNKCSSGSPGYGEWVKSKQCSPGDYCAIDPGSGTLLCKTP